MSRRAVLGVAVGVPLVGAASAGAPPPSFGWSPSPAKAKEEWEAALSGFRAAEAAVEEAGRVCSAAPRAEVGAAEELFGDRLEEMYDRLRRLLRAPAPDLRALGVKIELAFEHEVATLAGCAGGIAVLREDARRLCG